MSKFVLIGARTKNNSIRTAAFGDICENDQTDVKFLYAEKATGLGRYIQRIVTSKKLNRIVRMPLRTHWEIGYREVKPLLSETEDNYVIFVPGEQWYWRTSPSLIRNLRKYHKNCKLVYYFVDGVERSYITSRVSEEFLLDYLKQFDLVCTYSRQDAAKYGFAFVEIPVCHLPCPTGENPAYTLHFSGVDKNRADLLSGIKSRLESAGLNHFLHVVASPNSDRTRKDISYSAFKDYSEVVRDMQRANCACEIIAMHNSSATLRYKEAIIYKKKLLTNNPSIFLLPYYNEHYMRYFEKPEDVDLEWLGRIEDVDYGYKGDFTARHFLETVEKLCRTQHSH